MTPSERQEHKKWISQLDKTSTLPRKSFTSTTSSTSTTGTLVLDRSLFHLVQCPTALPQSKRIWKLGTKLFLSSIFALTQEQKHLAIPGWFRCHSLPWERHGQAGHPGHHCQPGLRSMLTMNMISGSWSKEAKERAAICLLPHGVSSQLRPQLQQPQVHYLLHQLQHLQDSQVQRFLQPYNDLSTGLWPGSTVWLVLIASEYIKAASQTQ